MFNLESLIRGNIKNLSPYSSARDEFSGEASVFLDANENALGSPLLKWYNRYPDPMQWELKGKIAFIKQVPKENIFLGNGSDEPIDNLLRCFCEPGIDEIIVMPPTYGMYEVYANAKLTWSDWRMPFNLPLKSFGSVHLTILLEIVSTDNLLR